MFVEDINRKINGVVKVDEDENKALEQELNEYSYYTRRAEAAFCRLFQYLIEAFDEPTAHRSLDLRLFGSGKISLLENVGHIVGKQRG